MVNGITWEEETLARIQEARDKKKQAQDTADQKMNEANILEEYVKTLEKALELTKQQHSISPNGHETFGYEHLRTQSTWDSLVDIMATNKGLLVVIDAVTILVKAGVFKDREHARNVIYSTLYAHKQDVQKVRRGIYRLRSPDSKESKPKTKHAITGLKEVLKGLKQLNPQWTWQEAKNHLVTAGFDFEGKSPSRVIRIAWANLGRAKRSSPQPKFF